MSNFIKAIKNLKQYHYVIFAGWSSRIVIAGIQLISIPLILRLLGIDNYAIFAVITGMIVWFKLGDAGMGPSIQNAISNLRVQQGDTQHFLQEILFFILAIGLVEIIVFSVCAPFLQALLLRKFSVAISPYLLMIIGDLYILAALFGVAYNIFFAQQRGYWAYLYQTLSFVIGLILVLIFYFTKSTHHLFLILFFWVFPQMLFAFIGFLQVMPWRGFLKQTNFAVFKRVFLKSYQYSCNAIGAAFVLGIDYIVMSQLISTNDITVYNIFNKIFSFAFFGYNAILLALWPVLAEDYASRARQRIRAANNRLLKNIGVAAIYILLATIAVLILKGFLLKLFSSARLVVPTMVIILFGIYYIIRVWTDSFAMAIQSRNKIAFIAATVPIQAIVSVAFLYYFGKYFGLNGIVIGLALCFLVTASWMLPLYHYLSLKKIHYKE